MANPMPAFTYQPRPVSFLELWTHGAWRLKVYGIAWGRDRPAPELVQRAKELAVGALGGGADHYGVGFIGVHQGKTAHFIFVDWWARENELNHHVYISSLDDPLVFEDATATGVAACVWDLAVIAHERDAWVETVLKTGGANGFDAYLQRRMEGEV
jgi:hypothetical protein